MMAANNILPKDDNDRPIRNTTIEITNRTVRFGSDVYQFRNVTGFGLAPVKNENLYPIQVILGLFVIGLFCANIPDSSWRILGMILILLAIWGFSANTSQPKKYGLKLYLNSGSPSPVFITSDMEGLENVVSVLYKFMESNEEGTYIIHAQDRSIRIEGNFEGNFIGGDASGPVSNKR
jgi:hypothetical protein